MKVYPVKGGEGLRDPVSRAIIPKTGWEVQPDPFWLQCLAHGSVSLDPYEAEKKTIEHEVAPEPPPAQSEVETSPAAEVDHSQHEAT